jgi:biopolymer transport protein TolQ
MQPPTPDFSVGSLFFQADPVVKAVIILLGSASVAAWTIIIDKIISFGRIRRELRRFAETARDRTTRPAANSLAAAILDAGLAAAADHGMNESRAERRERLRETMRLVMAETIRASEPGLPFLATVGSAAPFVGLFGTVWGIMGSFARIAAANDTSLSVVAPGIAEGAVFHRDWSCRCRSRGGCI